MVGNRWESSNRPLFIKTVWKDGQHHVIFKKEEEETFIRTARSARKNPVSSRKKPNAENSGNFKVPSVKLILAGLKNFKNENFKLKKSEKREFIKSAITVDVIPSDSVRFSDLNKQVFFKNERRKFKSSSMEVKNNSENLSPPPFSYSDYYFDQNNTTLSERVMIWLDLAIQNNHKQIQKINVKKTEIGNKPKIEQKELPLPVVASQMEVDFGNEPQIEAKLPELRSSEKRQLHIFLPVLPKKTSDSGSFLSSKSSSLFQKSNR